VNGYLYDPAASALGREPPYPLYRRLDGPQNRSGSGGEEKNSQPLLESNTGRPTYSLVTILTIYYTNQVIRLSARTFAYDSSALLDFIFIKLIISCLNKTHHTAVTMVHMRQEGLHCATVRVWYEAAVVACSRVFKTPIYEAVSKSLRTGRLERQL
jgi:hypothetical protein